MNRIFLTGTTARTLRRLARHERGVTLERSSIDAIEPPSRSRSAPNRLDLARLRSFLSVSGTHGIELLVPTPKDRIRARGITCHVQSKPLPSGSFLRLVRNETGDASDPPSDTEVFVESPCLAVLSAARQLGKLVSQQVMSSTEADLRLFKLAMEDCSTYALDPIHPMDKDCLYGIEPVLTKQDLDSYLHDANAIIGLQRAAKVAEWLVGRSASPMETFLCAGYSLPPSSGGLGFPQPKLNHTIHLSHMKQLMLNHTERLTPDLLWEAWSVLIEYLGAESHEGDGAQDEDMGRIQDFEVLGYRPFPVRYRHVKTPTSFNRLAARVATAMESQGAQGIRAWVDELVSYKDFLATQLLLFKVMLPPVWSR